MAYTVYLTAADVATVAGDGIKLREISLRKIHDAIGGQDFAVSGLTLSAGAGLTLNIATGEAFIAGWYVSNDSSDSVSLTASKTNYLYLQLTLDGNSKVTAADVVANVTGIKPSNSLYLGYAITGAGSISSVSEVGRKTASSVAQHDTDIANGAAVLGTGGDGPGLIATIAAIGVTPTLSAATGNTVDMSGLGACKAKIAWGNLSGTVVASSATGSVTPTSAQRLAISDYQIPASAAYCDVFLQIGGAGSYYFAKRVPIQDLGDYIYIDQIAFDASYTAPGSDTTSATTATISARHMLTSLALTNGQTINIANTGNYGGFLDLRIKGDVSFASGAVIDGIGDGRLLFDTHLQNKDTPGSSAESPNSTAWPPNVTSDEEYPGTGIGAQPFAWFHQSPGGAGSAGGGASNPDGGWPGATLIIAARTWSLAAGTINMYGAQGAAGTATGAQRQSGSGGGAGGKVALFSLTPAKFTGTIVASGADGRAAVGTGGASTAYGGAGGGGGLICFFGPLWNTASATLTNAGGAVGSNVTTAQGAVSNSGCGGSHAGTGGQGAVSGSGLSSGNAGQTLNMSLYSGVLALMGLPL